MTQDFTFLSELSRVVAEKLRDKIEDRLHWASMDFRPDDSNNARRRFSKDNERLYRCCACASHLSQMFKARALGQEPCYPWF